jgi:hypothetical protein
MHDFKKMATALGAKLIFSGAIPAASLDRNSTLCRS